MPSSWQTVAVLGVLALFTPRAAAADPKPDRVRALVQQLDSDDFAEREQADQALRRLGVSVLPLLRTELEKKPAVEVERRLKTIVRDVGRLNWHHDLGKALQESKRTGKPLLVFSALGHENGFGSVAAQAMQRGTFADARVHAALPRDFVLYWHDRIAPGWEQWFLEIHAQQFPGASLDAFVEGRLRNYVEGRGAGSVVTFFCAPDGRIVYPLPGYRGPDRYLREAEAARQLVRKVSDAKPARDAVASRLKRLTFPEPMDKELRRACNPPSELPASVWQRELRPDVLPLVEKRIESVMADLARQTALTH
jgi:hypothetical protein